MIVEKLPPFFSGKLFAALLGLFALAFLAPGARLLLMGGSAYYVAAGALLAVSGLLLWRRDPRALVVFAALLLGTIVWSVWESGFDAWALAPRVIWIFALSLYFLLPGPWSKFAQAGAAYRLLPLLPVALAALLSVGVALSMQASASRRLPQAAIAHHAPAADAGEWREYGRDSGGSRFSPLDQITPSNVSGLTQIWSYRAGMITHSLPKLEVTPIKIGDRLFICAGDGDVVALDAEDGHQVWRFDAHVDFTHDSNTACRGVSYYKKPNGTGPCAERLFTATADRRLVAVDVVDGKACRDFGRNGEVDLTVGMGLIDPGVYQMTSAPQVVSDRVILGGKIGDNLSVDEPSGVIRAFNAVSGDLAWAWDMGRPDRHGAPGANESYTRSTPNSWAPTSADAELGLVYLPIGNPSPDRFGGLRHDFDERYGSSVVALDVATGAVRWSFQTVHHDLWDYDVPAQPTVVDLPNGAKAVIVATKRGEVFLLDRRTGAPLSRVEERATPQGGPPEDRLSPTQPFSVDMPSFAGAEPSERRMWGLTPFDQMWCRMQFRAARFEGTLTPLQTGRPTLVWPGFLGGFEWGGVSVDTDRNLMIVNTNNVSNYDQLLTRAQAQRAGPASFTGAGWTSAQKGAPYAVHLAPFLSPLGVPCTQPPYGTLAAVDLVTHRIVWSRSFGTTAGSGPLDMRTHLPIPMGVPNIGGAVTTRGGVFFIAASQDGFLRAYETATGRELWRTALPAGGQATPMTYFSERSHRQFVVIAAGGHGGLRTPGGDYIMAYALPQRP